jgi:hypothetical protein
LVTSSCTLINANHLAAVAGTNILNSFKCLRKVQESEGVTFIAIHTVNVAGPISMNSIESSSNDLRPSIIKLPRNRERKSIYNYYSIINGK